MLLLAPPIVRRSSAVPAATTLVLDGFGSRSFHGKICCCIFTADKGEVADTVVPAELVGVVERLLQPPPFDDEELFNFVANFNGSFCLMERFDDATFERKRRKNQKILTPIIVLKNSAEK